MNDSARNAASSLSVSLSSDALALQALQSLAEQLPNAQIGRRPRPGRRMRAARQRGATFGLAFRTNMTPMIDVVFQLLVFFIATTRYASDERVIAMDLSRRTVIAEKGNTEAPPPPPPADPFVLQSESLRLEVRVDGTIAAGAPLRKIYTPPELRAALADQLRGVTHPLGMFEPAFPIVIAPADGAPWEAAVEALDAAVAAGFRNVGFDQRPELAGKAP